MNRYDFEEALMKFLGFTLHVTGWALALLIWGMMIGGVVVGVVYLCKLLT